MTDKMRKLCEAVGQYGVQCSETKELAPPQYLLDAVKNVESDNAKLREELARLKTPMEPVAWQVSRDVEYESREFFTSEGDANKNATLGFANTHVLPLFAAPPTFLLEEAYQRGRKEAETKIDAVGDSNFIAGMKFGWNWAMSNDNARFNAVVEQRIEDRVELRRMTDREIR